MVRGGTGGAAVAGLGAKHSISHSDRYGGKTLSQLGIDGKTPAAKAVARIVNSERFDGFSAVIVGVNALVVGFQSEETLQQHLHDSEARAGVDLLFTVAADLFALFYVWEVGMKIFAWRQAFFTNSAWRWNWFDLTLAATATWEVISNLVSEANAGGWTIVLRLMKILKLLRMVRMVRFFPELRTMLFCIVGSVRTLFWTILMLGLILYVFGLCFVQAITSQLTPGDNGERLYDDEFRTAVVNHWGSVPGAMITLFEAITGGNDWGALAQPLKDINGFYYVIFLFYILFLVFAVLNILTGIFVDSAMAHGRDSEMQARQKERDREDAWVTVMTERFGNVDDNHYVTWEEFKDHLSDHEVQLCMVQLGIDLEEAQRFFRLLGERPKAGGQVHVRDFIECCMRLKGQARSMDQSRLFYECRENFLATQGVMARLDELQNFMDGRFHDMLVRDGAKIPRLTHTHTSKKKSSSNLVIENDCSPNLKSEQESAGGALEQEDSSEGVSLVSQLLPAPALPDPMQVEVEGGILQVEAGGSAMHRSRCISELVAAVVMCEDVTLLQAMAQRIARRVADQTAAPEPEGEANADVLHGNLPAATVLHDESLATESTRVRLEQISSEFSDMREELWLLRTALPQQAGVCSSRSVRGGGLFCSACPPCSKEPDHEEKRLDLKLELADMRMLQGRNHAEGPDSWRWSQAAVTAAQRRLPPLRTRTQGDFAALR